MKKTILSLFIFASLFFASIATVSACSCLRPAPPLESLEQSTAVFAGEVVDIKVLDGVVVSSADPVKVTFEVSQTWKGPDYKTLVLTTARDSASCGYSFEEGEEYIVYAYGESDKLTTNICSRTNILASAQDDLQELGTSSSLKISKINYTSPVFNPILVLMIVGGVIILIIVTALLVRKYKK